MKDEVLFSFISRSGGHAIIYWVAGMLKGDVRYDHHWKDKSKILLFKNGKENKLQPKDVADYPRKLYSIENRLDEDINPTITIIRSPENLYASLYERSKIARKWYADEDQIQSLYLDHCTNHNYLIVYDLWFRSETYRRKIAADLGLEYNEMNLNYVSNFGNGSSFDRREYNHQGNLMKVLERWKQIPWERLEKFFVLNDQMKPKYQEILEEHKTFCPEVL